MFLRSTFGMNGMIQYFENYDKIERSTTFSAPFASSLLKLGEKLIPPITSFRFKKTDIDNQYDLIYRRLC